MDFVKIFRGSATHERSPRLEQFSKLCFLRFCPPPNAAPARHRHNRACLAQRPIARRAAAIYTLRTITEATTLRRERQGRRGVREARASRALPGPLPSTPTSSGPTAVCAASVARSDLNRASAPRDRDDPLSPSRARRRLFLSSRWARRSWSPPGARRPPTAATRWRSGQRRCPTARSPRSGSSRPTTGARTSSAPNAAARGTGPRRSAPSP